jgi:hypothetical protein
MTPQPERPEQGKFSKDETNYLKTHLPAYEAFCHQLADKATGPKGTGSVKGCKKDWVISKVFPEYVKQFSSDQEGGPQLQSLQTVCFLLRHVLVAVLLMSSRKYCDGSPTSCLLETLARARHH